MFKYLKVQKIAAMRREPTASEYVRFWAAKILVDSTSFVFNLPKVVVGILSLVFELIGDLLLSFSNHLDLPTFKRWIYLFVLKAFVLEELLGLKNRK